MATFDCTKSAYPSDCRCILKNCKGSELACDKDTQCSNIRGCISKYKHTGFVIVVKKCIPTGTLTKATLNSVHCAQQNCSK